MNGDSWFMAWWFMGCSFTGVLSMSSGPWETHIQHLPMCSPFVFSMDNSFNSIFPHHSRLFNEYCNSNFSPCFHHFSPGQTVKAFIFPRAEVTCNAGLRCSQLQCGATSGESAEWHGAPKAEGAWVRQWFQTWYWRRYAMCMCIYIYIHTGWWFGTCFPYIGNNHPNWLSTDFHIFQRGWNHQPAYIYICVCVTSFDMRDFLRSFFQYV